MELRRALSSDADQIWTVRARAIRSGCRAHYAAQDIETWASAPMHPTFPARVAQEEFVVAELGARIIGFAGLKAETKEIDALFVCPDFAGQRLGTRLLAHVETLARSLGIKVVTLKASLNSVAFYQAAGYIAGSPGWHVTGSGLKIACVHMAKVLTNDAARWLRT